MTTCVLLTLAGHAHFVKEGDPGAQLRGEAAGARRHLFFQRGPQQWAIAPVCNTNDGTHCQSETENHLGSWMVMPGTGMLNTGGGP